MQTMKTDQFARMRKKVRFLSLLLKYFIYNYNWVNTEILKTVICVY